MPPSTSRRPRGARRVDAIARGLRLLTLFPEQRRIGFDAFEEHAATAVDEIVRFEPVISHMCRVRTRDVEIRGVRIAAGETVALWYPSADRDEGVFADADTFEVRRPTKARPGGVRRGRAALLPRANLARHEMTVMFDDIRRRVPTLAVTERRSGWCRWA